MISRTLIVGAIGTTLMTAPAAADVLVENPDSHLSCGGRIKTGVWYQTFSGGPRTATIQILSVRKLVLSSRHARATTTWRYWYYHPRCGRTYYVRYLTPGAPPYTVRVRVQA